MLASATKKSSCPCCHGTGPIEENATLIGIAPLLDRPSGVNDDDWESVSEEEIGEPDGEKTSVCEVPTFRRPNRGDVRRAPPVLARDSEYEVAGVHRRDELLSPPKARRFRPVGILVAALLLGTSLGALAGTHADRWLPAVARLVAQQRWASAR